MNERYSAFKDNYLKIEKHNATPDQHGRPSPFKMAVNRFSDMTETEFVQERLSSGGAKPHQRKKERHQAHKALKLIRPLGPDGKPLPEIDESE